MTTQTIGPEPNEHADPWDLARRQRVLAVVKLGALERIGDPALTSLTRLARSVTGASAAAVHIFDEKYQRRIAASGTSISDHLAEDAMCRVVVESGEPVITSDATQEPRFDYSSLVHGPTPVRFYASLPVTVAGATTVGTLCAFDTEVLSLNKAQTADLEDIAMLVRSHLDLMELANDLSTEATRDGLTGVTNRVTFDGLVGRALADRRRSGDDVLVAVIDVDDFKTINDTHGHGVGDDALRWVGGRLTNLLSPFGGAVGRLGGDEFSVVAQVGTADAEGLINDMRHATDGFAPDFRVSVGSTFADDDDDVSSLLRRADKRMYVAKASRGVPNRRLLNG